RPRPRAARPYATPFRSGPGGRGRARRTRERAVTGLRRRGVGEHGVEKTCGAGPVPLGVWGEPRRRGDVRCPAYAVGAWASTASRSEEHTSELQSRENLV